MTAMKIFKYQNTYEIGGKKFKQNLRYVIVRRIIMKNVLTILAILNI